LALAQGAEPAARPPLVEKYLVEGRLADGEKAAREALQKNLKDDEVRFGLGAVQFLQGIEHLGQALYRYGRLQDNIIVGVIPFLRIPVPPNPKPEPVRYDDVRDAFRTLVDDLTRAEATLAKVEADDVKLPLHFARIRLDLNDDGRGDSSEALWQLYARLNAQAGQGAGPSEKDAEAFVICFDRGDVAWLRGYCHLLSAFAEFYLAHDFRESFDHGAHLVFAKPETPFKILVNREPEKAWSGYLAAMDAIATVHAIRLPVEDPKRLTSALGHLSQMIVLSRESWKYYLQEADDDREWIPNPKQSTVIPGVTVNDEMVKGWMEFLDEADLILAGKRLIPFWREAGGRGVNLRRVFTEPTTFDLVFWVQGSAATPYLEEGSITKPEVWRRLQRVFRGEFIGFAIWFN
jgi:hypothetical protein